MLIEGEVSTGTGSDQVAACVIVIAFTRALYRDCGTNYSSFSGLKAGSALILRKQEHVQ